jgi:two-component system, LytTR family, response regulator
MGPLAAPRSPLTIFRCENSSGGDKPNEMPLASIRTLVVDDEEIARRVLRDELDLIPEIHVIGEAENGRDALDQILETQPDLVFLDLQMPLMSGFDVIHQLTGSRLPVIVIVTAFQQHAIQAFDAGAVDYLLKPVRGDRLHKAIDKAKSLLGKPREIAQELARISSVAPPSTRPDPVQKLVSRMGREYFLLDVGEVLALQAEGELVWILTEKKKYLANQSLRALELRLPNWFQRVHRNAIVNVNQVSKMTPLTSNRWLITLHNDQEFVVSKRQAHHIRRLLHGEAFENAPVRG